MKSSSASTSSSSSSSSSHERIDDDETTLYLKQLEESLVHPKAHSGKNSVNLFAKVKSQEQYFRQQTIAEGMKNGESWWSPVIRNISSTGAVEEWEDWNSFFAKYTCSSLGGKGGKGGKEKFEEKYRVVFEQCLEALRETAVEMEKKGIALNEVEAPDKKLNSKLWRSRNKKSVAMIENEDRILDSTGCPFYFNDGDRDVYTSSDEDEGGEGGEGNVGFLKNQWCLRFSPESRLLRQIIRDVRRRDRQLALCGRVLDTWDASGELKDIDEGVREWKNNDFYVKNKHADIQKYFKDKIQRREYRDWRRAVSSSVWKWHWKALSISAAASPSFSSSSSSSSANNIKLEGEEEDVKEKEFFNHFDELQRRYPIDSCECNDNNKSKSTKNTEEEGGRTERKKCAACTEWLSFLLQGLRFIHSGGKGVESSSILLPPTSLFVSSFYDIMNNFDRTHPVRLIAMRRSNPSMIESNRLRRGETEIQDEEKEDDDEYRESSRNIRDFARLQWDGVPREWCCEYINRNRLNAMRKEDENEESFSSSSSSLLKKLPIKAASDQRRIAFGEKKRRVRRMKSKGKRKRGLRK